MECGRWGRGAGNALQKPILKNRMVAEVEQAIAQRGIDWPAGGNQLWKQALTLSPAGVRRIWLHDDFETMRKWLTSVEALV